MFHLLGAIAVKVTIMGIESINLPRESIFKRDCLKKDLLVWLKKYIVIFLGALIVVAILRS